MRKPIDYSSICWLAPGKPSSAHRHTLCCRARLPRPRPGASCAGAAAERWACRCNLASMPQQTGKGGNRIAPHAHACKMLGCLKPGSGGANVPGCRRRRRQPAHALPSHQAACTHCCHAAVCTHMVCIGLSKRPNAFPPRRTALLAVPPGEACAGCWVGGRWACAIAVQQHSCHLHASLKPPLTHMQAREQLKSMHGWEPGSQRSRAPVPPLRPVPTASTARSRPGGVAAAGPHRGTGSNWGTGAGVVLGWVGLEERLVVVGGWCTRLGAVVAAMPPSRPARRPTPRPAGPWRPPDAAARSPAALTMRNCAAGTGLGPQMRVNADPGWRCLPTSGGGPPAVGCGSWGYSILPPCPSA